MTPDALHDRPAQPLTLGLLAAGIAAAAAAAGLIRPALYAPTTPPQFLAGAMSQDILTLIVAALALWTNWRLRAGAARLWPVWLGLMGYLVYAYGLYAFEKTYNPVFPLYIAVFGCAIWAVVTFFAGARPDRIGVDAGRAPPRRLTAGVLLALAAMFSAMWLATILPASMASAPQPGNAIFVMDLGFTLPLLVVTARLLWLGRAWGDRLAVPVLIKAGTLGASVLLGTLIAPAFDRAIDPADLAIYGALTALPLALAWPFLSALRVAPPAG